MEKLIIMLNENISAANMKKNEIISFDGYKKKQINGKDSLDETVEYFRDYYNVNSFSETELDVVIVYSEVATDLVMYFAEKFSEAKSVSVFNLSIIAPVIVRRRKMKPPVKVSFMGSSVVIGDNKNCTEIKADHTDLKFMFDTDNSFWEDESLLLKNEIKMLEEQISELKKQISKKEAEINQKDGKIRDLDAILQNREKEKNNTHSTFDSAANNYIAKRKVTQETQKAEIRHTPKDGKYIIETNLPQEIIDFKKKWKKSSCNIYLQIEKETGSSDIHSTGIAKLVLNFGKWYSYLSGGPFNVEQDIKPVLTQKGYRCIVGSFDKTKGGFRQGGLSSEDVAVLIDNWYVESDYYGKLFWLVTETDEIEDRQPIAVVGLETDTCEDINKWLSISGKGNLRCIESEMSVCRDSAKKPRKSPLRSKSV